MMNGAFSRAIINNQRETGHEEWIKKKYYIPYLLVTQLEWINAYSNESYWFLLNGW